MMKRILTLFILLVAERTLAHDFWIEPSTFHPASGDVVYIGLRVGERFAGEPVSRNPARIVRFEAHASSGTTPVLGASGRNPAGWLRVEGEESIVVTYQSRPTIHSPMKPDVFEAYLREEGLDSVLAHRARHGTAREPGREMFSRSARAILCGRGAVRTPVDPPGLPLEIVPLTDPCRMESDEFLGRIVFKGQPLANALVVAMQRNGRERVEARSDTLGRVTLRLPSGGPWLIKSVHMIAAPASSGVDWESIWASLTFERVPRLR